jgi:aerobic carbon-monoxide dehydrogenase small subunit
LTQTTLSINGKEYSFDLEPRLLLVHCIRENAKLKGTHIGCDTGHCGACTVLLDGKPIKSCQIFAIQTDGRQILTVEGLGSGDVSALNESKSAALLESPDREKTLSLEQKAFQENFAVQCGYCTPGMLMMTYYLIRKHRTLSREEIRESIHGNYCMCTGYFHIVNAVEQAHKMYWENGGNYTDPAQEKQSL